MTLDEAIKHCEEIAEDHDKLRKRYDDASGYSRSHNESIRTNDAKKHEKCGQDFRQLAGWLKELKAYKEQEPCEDAISRQAVLDAMYELCNTEETLGENPWRDNPHIDVIIDAIGDLPSVTPQQKVGKWEIVTCDLYMCSKCYGKYTYKSNFCPNCGAKME
jgi:hypothetical protein